MKRTKSKLLPFLIVLLAASLCLTSGCSENQDGTADPTASPSATAKATASSSTEATPTAEAEPTAPASPTPLKLTDPPEGYDANDKAAAADLLDLVFEDGEAKDQSAAQLELTPINDPIVETDPLINKTAAEFLGSGDASINEISMYAAYGFGANYHATLEDGFSFEVYAKITDDTMYGTLLGYMQGGGFGIDFDPNNAENDLNGGANASIGFCMYDIGAGGYVNLYHEEPVELDRYYHVVGTFDGSTMSLYYDGQLIKSTEITGPLQFPQETSQYLGIGGDAGPTDQGVLGMNGSLAIARIYSTPLTASQVYNLYLDAVQ